MHGAGKVVFVNDLVRREFFCLIRIAQAGRNVQTIGHIEGPLGKCRHAFIIECTTAAEARYGEIQFIDVIAVLSEVIKTDDPLQPVTVRIAEQLNFLRKLILLKIVPEL